MALATVTSVDTGDSPASPRPTSSVQITVRGGPFSPGNTIADKYRVDRELAEGGLGVVVVAKHIALGHDVAIKYLKPEVLEKPALVERFRREARLAASIGSEHVVRVFDVGELEVGGPYMVMEYLDGEDLSTRLGHGTLAEEDVVGYVVQACEALAEAHALGIVHRDLKPENLFVTRRGVLKVLDFGISKFDEAKLVLAGTTRGRRMTEDGESFGTPVYMSPEQLRHAGRVDARTDIWALGVVMFELLTGAVPFSGDSVPELGASILTGEPIPLRELRPAASEAFEAVILRCLAKDPAERYADVGELVKDLLAAVAHDEVVEILESSAIVARPKLEPPPRVTKKPYALAAAALLAAIAIGATARARSAPVDDDEPAVSSRAPQDAPAKRLLVEPPAPPRPAAPAPVVAAPAAPKPVAAPKPAAGFDYSEFGDRK